MKTHRCTVQLDTGLDNAYHGHMNTTSTPTAIMTMGLPGSGKSTTAARLYDTTEYELIDCDAWKTRHPDYDPKNPAGVHDWSKAKADAQKFEAIADRKNLIVDSTGTNAERMVAEINELHGRGYSVTVLYVKVSMATALDRNAKRDRTVPEQIVREKASLMATAFDIVSQYADEVRIVRND